MILFALLGFYQGDASPAIQRFEKYMAQAKSFSVNETFSYNNVTVGKGVLKVAKPNRMSFVITGGNVDSKFVANAEGGVELEKFDRLYDEYPAHRSVYTPQSRMSAAVAVGVPRILLDGSLKALAPAEAKFTLTKKQTVNGVSTDLVQTSFTNQMTTLDLKLWIDADGRLIRYYRKVTTMEGSNSVGFDFANYAIDPSFPADTFSTKVPLGFSPLELSYGGESIEVGKPLPASQFVSAQSGKKASLKSLTDGKNALVLVMDPEFPSNAEMLKAANELATKVPDSRLVVIGSRKDLASTKKLGVPSAFYDPTGKELPKLELPGYPTVYLLDKKGLVVQAFFGFDGKFDGVEEALKRLKG